MQCILVKSDQFENSSPLLYIFLKSCLYCCLLASLAAQQLNLLNLLNRFSSSAHVQPNLTRGFKIASINLVSLYKNIDQLRIYMLSKTVDILAINETRLDSSI